MLLRTSQGFSTLLYPLCLWWPRETVPFLHFGSVIWSCRAGRASGLLFWSEWQWHIYVDEPYWVQASSESSPPRQHSPFSGIEAAGDIGLGYNEVERRHSKSFMWICQGTSTYDVREFWTPLPCQSRILSVLWSCFGQRSMRMDVIHGSSLVSYVLVRDRRRIGCRYFLAHQNSSFHFCRRVASPTKEDWKARIPKCIYLMMRRQHPSQQKNQQGDKEGLRSCSRNAV